MAVGTQDAIWAGAGINIVAGVVSFRTNNGFASFVDEGVGSTLLNLDAPLDALSMSIQASPRSAAVFAALTTEVPADGQIRVRAFDAAGAAVDNIGFDLIVTRLTLGT